MQDNRIRRIKRDEKQPVIWLLAHIGGSTSLTTGCSAVTVFEVLFFAVCYLFYVRRRWYKRKERERKKNEVEAKLRDQVQRRREGGTKVGWALSELF